MIVSESHNFIFVHIFKTAGTSVKRALRKYAMPAWQDKANFVFKRVGIPQFRPNEFPNHYTASQIINEIGRAKFDSYFTFAFVRNPWDWEFSHYKYICRNDQHDDHETVVGFPDFRAYLQWRCDNRYRLQSDYVSHAGEQVVDFIGRFENLDVDFKTVCEQIGVRNRLPKLNVTRKSSYLEAYDEVMIDLVRTTFRTDIEAFGYEFGN